MDFFRHQEEARRQTTLLVLYFLLAVLLIIAVVYCVAIVYPVLATAGDPAVKYAGPLDFSVLWHPRAFAWATGATLTVIALGCLHEISVLKDGGGVVAEALGATPVNADTTDPLERRLLNVVEEIAIASGLPVPRIYVMRGEAGINAFAAGFSTTDAVVTVTRGALETLSREGLQGVLAHEFSHILNGDMRLNMRLMGVLHGILLIGLLGRKMLAQWGCAMVLFAAALSAIGYIGVFFGRLIKSSISRQREFLADASAVQFTRNPSGLAGALRMIGGLTQGSKLTAPDAESASHLFFADGLAGSLPQAFATHPPLAERIRRLDPGWDGGYPEVSTVSAGAAGAKLEIAAAAKIAQEGVPSDRAAESLACIPLSAERSVALAGTATPAHLVYGRGLLSELPTVIGDAARQPFGATALVYALLINGDEAVRRDQLDHLRQHAETGALPEVLKLMAAVDGLSRASCLPIVDLSLPALRNLSKSQYMSFRGNLDALVAADDRVSPFEFAVLRVLRHHLDSYFSRRKRVVGRRAIRKLDRECGVLLSALAHIGHENLDAAAAAYRAGVSQLGIVDPLAGVPVEAGDFLHVDQALDALVNLKPMAKRELIAACAAAISRDGQVMLEEAEIFRAVADSLDVPMPPFLETDESDGH